MNEVIKAIRDEKSLTTIEFISDFGDEMFVILKDTRGCAYWFGDGWNSIALPIRDAEMFFEICDFIGIDSDKVSSFGGKYTIPQSCIDFELWCDDVQVRGYYDQNNQLEEYRFTWFSRSGLESSDINTTEPYYENTNEGFKTMFNWCMIVNLINHIDLASELIEHRCSDSDVKITYGIEECNDVKVELLIKGRESE